MDARWTLAAEQAAHELAFGPVSIRGMPLKCGLPVDLVVERPSRVGLKAAPKAKTIIVNASVIIPKDLLNVWPESARAMRVKSASTVHAFERVYRLATRRAVRWMDVRDLDALATHAYTLLPESFNAKLDAHADATGLSIDYAAMSAADRRAWSTWLTTIIEGAAR
jgi:hypothetical protein